MRHEELVIVPQALVFWSDVEPFSDKIQFRLQEASACSVIRPSLIQQSQDQLASIVPSGEVAQVTVDLFCCVLELAFHHTLSVQLRAFQLRDHLAAVAPRVEIALVLVQHLRYQSQFSCPDIARDIQREMSYAEVQYV